MIIFQSGFRQVHLPLGAKKARAAATRISNSHRNDQSFVRSSLVQIEMPDEMRGDG
jgi:hypothetical protein